MRGVAVRPSSAGLVDKAGRYGDLKRRLLFLLGALIVFRIGSYMKACSRRPISRAEDYQRVNGEAHST